MLNTLSPAPLARSPIEQGDPALDPRALRRCLGMYPTGVTVITAGQGAQRVGMAVNSFAAVSLSPPLVLWSIRRESGSLQAFLDASHFAVNILAAEQVETSQLFGSGHPERFEQTPWRAGACGAPLLNRAAAHLECRRVSVLEGGDHWILLGQVERYARFEAEPLLFSQGQYGVANSYPPGAPRPADVPAVGAAATGQPSFLKLLSETQQKMSALFEAHRRALGVTHATTRILTRLAEGACDLDSLEKRTYLGRDSLEDSLALLVAGGFAQRDGQGLWRLTQQGHRKREAVAERSARFTEEKLQGITEADVAAARRVLLALQQA